MWIIILGRGSEIRIYQIHGETKLLYGFTCPLLKTIKLSNVETVINLKWLDDFHLLALDSREMAHLVEIQKGGIIASFSIAASVDLVYNCSDFKASCFTHFLHKFSLISDF